MEPIYKEEKKEEDAQIIKPTINYLLLSLRAIFLVGILGLIFGFQLANFMHILFGIGGLIGSLLVIIIVFVLIVLFQKWSLQRTRYKFYNDRVEYFEGFLVKNRKTVAYDKITNIGQRKGIIEGLFGLGTVFIDTAGSSTKGHELTMKYLKDPDQVYDWITKTTRKKA